MSFRIFGGLKELIRESYEFARRTLKAKKDRQQIAVTLFYLDILYMKWLLSRQGASGYTEEPGHTSLHKR